MDKPVLKKDTPSEEILRLRRVEQELNTRLEQQARIAAFGEQAIGSTNLPRLLQEATELVVEILGVDFCKILELMPGDEQLMLVAGVGWKEGLIGNYIIDVDKNSSQGAYAIIASEPVIVLDWGQETRFEGPSLLLDHGVVSGLSVIIHGKTRPFGILGAHTTKIREFTPDDIHVLQSIANILASAIERHKTEEETRASRDQMSVILEGIADGITVQNTTGKLIYANQAAARLVGFRTADDLVNASTYEIMGKFQVFDETGALLPQANLPGRLAMLDGETHRATIGFLVLETGEKRWSIVKSTPILNDQSEVLMVVNIFQDVTELKRIEQSQRFLAEASEVLFESLDYKATLEVVARLAVTNLADWCSIDILNDNQTIEQVAIAHKDPQKVELARQLRNYYPLQLDSPTGIGKVLRMGIPEFYPDLEDIVSTDLEIDSERLALLQQLKMKSAFSLPIVARNRIIGALTFVWAESGHRYTDYDVHLAEELAQRASTAIDNALLYQIAQAANEELEARVARRTAQLQSLVSKLGEEIAERKRVQEALVLNEEMLTSLFESAPDATILIDSSGLIVRANTQTQVMFGYSSEELLGRPIDELMPERFRAIHKRYRHEYFSQKALRPMGAGLDLYGRRKDGSEFLIDIMLNPISTHQNELVIAAVRDISERKQMEAELAEVQQRLIEGVEAERLSLAQELHDGPIQDLYGITYQLKLLEESNLTPEDLESLRTVDKMTRQVIHLLRSICGELRPPALAPFGLEKAIQAHIDQLRENHPEMSIHTELIPDGQTLNERQRLALYRIYQHSVSNTLRHAQARNLYVRFSMTNQLVRLEVEDDGCGFRVPVKWVEMARQGHLGLVGTAERVKALGGNLEIVSSPGKGTIIRVQVPRSAKAN